MRDLYDSLKGMQNDESPGNYGLTKEFHETFWNHIRETSFKSIREVTLQNQLSISRREAIIK